MEPFNSEKIPEVLRQLFEKVEHLETLILKLVPVIQVENSLMSVKEAADFLQIRVPTFVCQSKQKENT